MADLGSTLKGIWMKGMEAIGNTASNIANNTKSKVDEMNLVNRRTEILKDFGNKAYALWQKGEQFPEELANQLKELEKLDEQLNDLRADRLAVVKTSSEQDKKSEVISENQESMQPEEPDDTTDLETDEIDTDDQNESELADHPEMKQQEEAVPVIQVEKNTEENSPVSGLNDAINDLFDKVPSVEQATDKVNDAIDSLENGLKQLSEDVDQKLDDLTEKLVGDKDDPPQE